MFQKKTRNSARVPDAWGVLFLIALGIVLGFKTGNADVLSGKKQHTKGAPEPMLLQGKIEANALGYTCSVRCKNEWVSFEFEVEKAARGDEHWRDTGALTTHCESNPTGTSAEGVKGGNWATPPQEPEDEICWLVVSVKRHSL